MAIKPILFNTEMVRAILDGRKTCTRRLPRKQIEEKYLEYEEWVCAVAPPGSTWLSEKEFYEEYPPYQLGDILYVRETWQCWRAHRYEATADIRFRAGGDDVRLQFANGNTDSINRSDYDAFINKWFSDYGEWKPSIFMPKEAARIWLKVTNVSVERLQNIIEDGAKAEGANWKNGKNVGWEEKMWRTAIERFAKIWDSTIKKSDLDRYGWNANPLVWVIEFERCEKPKEV